MPQSTMATPTMRALVSAATLASLIKVGEIQSHAPSKSTARQCKRICLTEGVSTCLRRDRAPVSFRFLQIAVGDHILYFRISIDTSGESPHGERANDRNVEAS